MSTTTHAAALARRWPASAAHLGARFDAPTLVAAHRAAGQFILVRSPTGDLPLALANAPGEPLELLIKRESPAGLFIDALSDGAPLTLVGPAGRGFPLAEHVGKDLLLCAAGSGVAPLRAVVHAVVRERARYGKVWMFYGQRRREELAFTDELAAWRTAGVDVRCVLSEADADWEGPRGHVYQALTLAAPELGHAVAFVSGMPEMVTRVTVAAERLGLAQGRVFLNY